VADAGHAPDHPLDFRRVDFPAADVDHVDRAAEEVQPAALVDTADVRSEKAARAELGRRSARDVAGGDRRAPDRDPSDRGAAGVVRGVARRLDVLELDRDAVERRADRAFGDVLASLAVEADPAAFRRAVEGPRPESES